MKTSSPWMFIAVSGTMSGLLLLAGCQNEANRVADRPLYMGISIRERGNDAPVATAAPAPRATAAPAAAPMARDTGNSMMRNGIRYEVTELFYPTGEKATSSILLRQMAPAEMRVGQEYEYTIDVINLTKGELQNVIVTSEKFSNLTYGESSPAFSKLGTGGGVNWMIGDLPAGGTKTITIKAKANALGTATNCLSVIHSNVLCIATNVVQPALQLTKTATPELCGTCDEIKLTYEVKNTGTGIAEKTVIKDTLPAGLTTLDGKSVVELNAGDLGAGMSKPFTVTAKAAKSGTFSSAASATASSGLTAQSGNPTTVVKQPALTVTCDASGKVFVGRDITYKFTVKNTGDCAASGASVSAPLPANSTFVSADNSGALQGGKVVWNMASLGAGQTATVTMKVKPTGIGSVPVTASATATCVPAATTNCATEVAGIPAILMEVVDTIDPVEVGTETTFIVTITNQGSADDDNIKVVLTLPDGLAFVSGTGPSAVTANGKTVTMAEVNDLFPQQKAVWQVRVKATAPGDVRTKWSMTSKQFAAPVEETESTNLFK